MGNCSKALLKLCSVYLFALLMGLTFISSIGFAQLDPRLEWKQIETEHFRVIYDAKYKQAAERFARYAEQSHRVLQPLFEETPDLTTILINDNTDQANAFATSLPYPLIHLYPVYPTAQDSIADHALWSYELVGHEYGHILAFEPSHGIFKPLRYLLGSVARPNFFLPRWYHEGVSVVLESLYTKNGGRLKSPSEQGDLRALALDKTLRKEDLARINESVPDWIGGRRPYLLGSLLILEIIKQNEDPKAIYHLTQRYSSRMPFLLNGPVEDLVKKNYEQLLDETYTQLESRAESQQRTISTQPVTKGVAVGQRGFDAHSPRFSRDGKSAVFIGRTDKEYANIQILKSQSPLPFKPQKAQTIYIGQRITKLSWLPDNKTVIFDDLSIYKRFNQYSDLFKLDTERKRSKQLTKGMRAIEPTVSPDGKWIAFRQNFEDGTRIARVDSDGKNFAVLYTPPPSRRVSDPEYIGEDRLVFSERDESGREILKIWTEGSEPIDTLENYAPASRPRYTNEGLIFVSSKSGVPNLYLANSHLNAARPLTNVETRTLEGDIHPISRELYFTKQTGEGSKLFKENQSTYALREKNLPRVDPLIDYKWPEFELPDVSLNIEEEGYSPWPYLVPRYWIPLVFAIQGGTLFQATTAAQDPTMRHSYSLQTQYDTLTNKVSTLGSYTNRTTPITYDLLGGNYYEYFYSGQFTRQTTTGTALGSWTFTGFQTSFVGSLGLNSSKTYAPNLDISRAGPTVSLSYTNTIQRGLDITPQTGGAANISHTQYLKDWGNTSYGLTMLGLSGYWQKGLKERHGFAGFVRGQYAPQMPRIATLYSTSQNGVYQFSLLATQFLTRGYLTGAFLGRNILNTSVEYRFPISNTFWGYGTSPFFIRRFHGALVSDMIWLDGAVYNTDLNTYMRQNTKRGFASVGAEIKMDLSLGYMLPAQAFLGLYYGLDQKVGGGFSPFIGFIF